jgi:transposase
VEQVPWATGKSPLTTSLIWFLARWAKRLSWADTAAAFQVSWYAVYRSVAAAVAWGRKHARFDDVSAIGIDEIAWQRGHKYLTMVYQIDAGVTRLLWVGQERTAKTLLRFFRWFGADHTARLQFICSDMWKPYLKVIARKASVAVHVLDRFHVMSTFNKALDELRAAEAKILAAQGKQEVLKHSRWALLKNPENLTDGQHEQLALLLKQNLKCLRAYLLPESFHRFWGYVSPCWAGKFLDSWCTRAMRSRIEPIQKVALMLRRHRSLLLNWFAARGVISLGATEGLNNKAKLTTKKAYGFRSFKVIEIALYHTLGHLPEPKFTHRFC